MFIYHARPRDAFDSGDARVQAAKCEVSHFGAGFVNSGRRRLIPLRPSLLLMMRTLSFDVLADLHAPKPDGKGPTWPWFVALLAAAALYLARLVHDYGAYAQVFAHVPPGSPIGSVALAGFVAQLVDGSLGMGYGVTSSTVLVAAGLTPKSKLRPCTHAPPAHRHTAAAHSSADGRARERQRRQRRCTWPSSSPHLSRASPTTPLATSTRA